MVMPTDRPSDESPEDPGASATTGAETSPSGDFRIKMPRPSAEQMPGVAAVNRAFSILDAFTLHDSSLSLNEIAKRTGLYKSTILRLIQSLEAWHCIIRLENGHYQLGPMLLHWSRNFQASLSLDQIVLPQLRQLTTDTGEGSSFFKREGDLRVCLYRVNPDRAIREVVMPGDVLSLNHGAAGRVLRDFWPSVGASAVLEAPVYVSYGETDPEVIALAAPVFQGPTNSLAGAVSVSGPRNRMSPTHIANVRERLLQTSLELTLRLGGNPQPLMQAS